MAHNLSARDILEILVGFPTVSRDSNLDLVDWVEGYLSGHGVAARRVYDDTGQKAAIYANVGPEVAGGVVLSGHTDVVPTDGQNWSTEPFTVVEKGGRLYGRGTCDMKGFDAIALAAVPKALAAGLKRPLQIALSYDEEVGCLGAPPMIDDMVGHLPRASAVIVGEPSRMKVVTGHKGAAGYHVHVEGFEVHSSLAHRGVSAIMRAAQLIDWANDENARIRAPTPSPVAAIFDPPFTTIHIGQIEGGTAHNITAKDCRFGLDFRFVPDDDADARRQDFLDQVAQVEAQMQAIHPDTSIALEPFFAIPPLRPETQGPAEALARAITGDNGTHVVSYGTEAGQFQDAGFSAVVCGPGDISEAHQPDEYIEISELEAGIAFVDRLIDTLKS